MALNYHSLVEEFAVTKKELGEAENTIRRLTGRDPDDVGNGSTKYRPSSSSRTYSGRKRTLYTYSGYDRKRSREECEESDRDESPEEESASKPSLQSTVVAKHHQARSRKATIEELNANSKMKARNRRMFGALIGTLELFQKEEKKRKVKERESMREKLEQKVEDANTKEKEKLKQEKESLFITRREKQVQLRVLEKKIERAESHEIYDTNYKKMSNFIMTKAKPPIFFLPSSHISATKKCLEDTKMKMNELIDKKRAELKTDLNEIEESYKKDSVSSSKEKESEENESNEAKKEMESQDVPEMESEPIVIELEDSNAEEDESTTDMFRPLGCSLNDQEFEPIYD